MKSKLRLADAFSGLGSQDQQNCHSAKENVTYWLHNRLNILHIQNWAMKKQPLMFSLPPPHFSDFPPPHLACNSYLFSMMVPLVTSRPLFYIPEFISNIPPLCSPLWDFFSPVCGSQHISLPYHQSAAFSNMSVPHRQTSMSMSTSSSAIATRTYWSNHHHHRSLLSAACGYDYGQHVLCWEVCKIIIYMVSVEPKAFNANFY